MGSERGTRVFSLADVAALVLIFGGLTTLVGPNLVHVDTVSDREVAEIHLQNLRTAVVMHRHQRGAWPATLRILTQPDPETNMAYLETIPLDPWGSPYVYEVLSETTVRLLSLGADGRRGTPDDVRRPEPRASP